MKVFCPLRVLGKQLSQLCTLTLEMVHALFLWEGLRAKTFLGCRKRVFLGNVMNSKVSFQLGESTRVTISSHDVARLTHISGLIRFMLSSDLRRRWFPNAGILAFPEGILCKDHLLILLGKNKIRKDKINVYEFIRALHYLNVDENDAIDLLDLDCCKCRNEYRECKYFHPNENGTYYERDFIPVLYFAHYLGNWQSMYDKILSFLGLRYVEVEESWSYNRFKVYVRAMLRSRERWLDDKHFRRGDFKRNTCYARGCRLELCDHEPPTDGWR